MNRSRRYANFIAVILGLLFTDSGCRPPRLTAPTSGGATSSAGVTGQSSSTRSLFVDVAAQAGISARLGHAHLSHISILDGIGHGCAFLDYDCDGKPDILIVTDGGAKLYHNLGGGKFEDVTARLLPRPPANCHFLGCSVADYDGDGRPDILLTGYGSTALYHNEPAGFRDVTAGSGLQSRGTYDWTTSAAWADVDGDGRLDVYVCRYVQFTPQSKQLCGQMALNGARLMMACAPTTYPVQVGSLYRNLGGGKFVDVTAESGLKSAHGAALACQFADFNGDSRPDLYIANDLRPADLFINKGHGRFQSVGIESGTAFGSNGNVMSGMGIDCEDFDNDGKVDLLVSNYARQPKSLFHNDGTGFFTNRIYQSGLAASTLLPLTFSANFLDYDNDGLRDILLVNGHVDSLAERVDSATSYRQSAQLFHNTGDGRFVDASGSAGPDLVRAIVGRGASIGDYDGDGRLDILIMDEEGAPMLLHNMSNAPAHWISVRCRTGAHRSVSVGAKLSIKSGGLAEYAEQRASGSYLSVNDEWVHFGLAKSTRVDHLEVKWPDGRKTDYANLEVDRRYEVVEGDLTPKVVP